MDNNPEEKKCPVCGRPNLNKAKNAGTARLHLMKNPHPDKTACYLKKKCRIKAGVDLHLSIPAQMEIPRAMKIVRLNGYAGYEN